MKSLRDLNTFSTSTVVFTDEALGVGQILPNRYQINGLIDTAKPVLDNIESIASAAGSWLSYDIIEGRWGVVINQSTASIASFNDSNIIGNISVSGTGLQDLYNAVKVEFPHRELRDSADFVSAEILPADRNPNEVDNTLNISYPIINDPVQANLLGLIELKQSRIDLVIRFVTDFSYINLKAGDVIDVTEPRFGFAAKKFRIVAITEIQDEESLLQMEITALEYNESVYDTSDLYKYTRTDENGIVTLGSIGIPGTPQVTKYEADVRPRIIIETLVPTGVVDGIEFWLSTDAALPEEQRSYVLIGVKKPDPGGAFAAGQQVSLDYDNVSTGFFVVKTRGFNVSTTGPFSSPSGLVAFTSTQITQAIGPDTSVIDALGTVGTILGAYSLLKGVDELYQKVANTGSLFTKIFETFEDITGVDLVGDAEGGNLGSPSITIQDEGNVVINPATTINFVGDGVRAYLTGTVVNVEIGDVTPPPSPLPFIYSVTPNVGPTGGGTVVTVEGGNFISVSTVTVGASVAASVTVVNSTTLSLTTPPGPVGPAAIIITNPAGTNAPTSFFTYIDESNPQGVVVYDRLIPPDRNTFQDPLTGITSDRAPRTGSYFFTVRGRAFAGPLAPGEGTVKLYKSDGTLVETLTPAQAIIDNEVIELPFADREYGTDYYILVDQGFVKYCGDDLVGLPGPTSWNFNTPPYDVDPAVVASTLTFTIPPLTATVEAVYPVGTSICLPEEIGIAFSDPVVTGNANVYIKNYLDDSIIATIPGNEGTVNGSSITYGSLKSRGLTPGVSYYITADAGYARSGKVVDCFIGPLTSLPAITGKGYNGTIAPAMTLTQVQVESDPIEGDNRNKINIQSNIRLVFNRSVSFGTGTITINDITLGSPHQSIDVNTTFAANKTSEIIWTDPAASNAIVINPTRDFVPGHTYNITIQNGSFVDQCHDEPYAGVNNIPAFAWTADPGPEVTTSTDLPVNSTEVVMTYDRPIALGTGTIVVYNSNDEIVATIPNTDNSVTLQ